MNKSFNIESFLDLTGYEESRLSRRKGAGSTQEFFTPYSIVKKMCDKVSDEDWSDPNKTFCEPCFGNGQFLIYIIYNRILHGVSWKRALETTYGLELMEDNVDECKDRVILLLKTLDIDFNEEIARDIMDKNLVCSNFFDWDFEHWKEINHSI